MRLGHERWRRDQSGLAATEFALIAPLLLMLTFAALEVAWYAVNTMRVSRIAIQVADNASRMTASSPIQPPRVREGDINDVLALASVDARGLPFDTRGRVILSSLEANATGGQMIAWQRCAGALPVASAYGPEGRGRYDMTLAGMGPGAPRRRVTAARGNPVMFVEVTYDHRGLLGGGVFGLNRRIRAEASYLVRDDRDLSVIENPSPAAPVRRCT